MRSVIDIEAASVWWIDRPTPLDKVSTSTLYVQDFEYKWASRHDVGLLYYMLFSDSLPLSVIPPERCPKRHGVAPSYIACNKLSPGATAGRELASLESRGYLSQRYMRYLTALRCKRWHETKCSASS